MDAIIFKTSIVFENIREQDNECLKKNEIKSTEQLFDACSAGCKHKLYSNAFQRWSQLTTIKSPMNTSKTESLIISLWPVSLTQSEWPLVISDRYWVTTNGCRDKFWNEQRSLVFAAYCLTFVQESLFHDLNSPDEGRFLRPSCPYTNRCSRACSGVPPRTSIMGLPNDLGHIYSSFRTIVGMKRKLDTIIFLFSYFLSCPTRLLFAALP